MEIKCLECGKSVKQTPGKRKKEYCGPTCRTKFWKKQKDAGKEKRQPGRPKKAQIANNLSEGEVSKTVKKTAKTSKPVDGVVGIFMGHKIPEGLTGIDLSIWKANIKEQS